LNSLRNKLSHNINFQIASKDLLPLTDYLKKSAAPLELTDPKEILEQFTMMVCVWFASGINSTAQQSKITRK